MKTSSVYRQMNFQGPKVSVLALSTQTGTLFHFQKSLLSISGSPPKGWSLADRYWYTTDLRPASGVISCCQVLKFDTHICADKSGYMLQTTTAPCSSYLLCTGSCVSQKFTLKFHSCHGCCSSLWKPLTHHGKLCTKRMTLAPTPCHTLPPRTWSWLSSAQSFTESLMTVVLSDHSLQTAHQTSNPSPKTWEVRAATLPLPERPSPLCIFWTLTATKFFPSPPVEKWKSPWISVKATWYGRWLGSRCCSHQLPDPKSS